MEMMLVPVIALGAFVLGFAIAFVIIRGQSSSEKPPVEEKKVVEEIVPVRPAVQEEVVDDSDNELELKKKELEKTTDSLKVVLVELALSMSNVDGAASKSNTTLNKVKAKVNSIDLTNGLEACQRLLVREVDSVLKANNNLKNELKTAQDELNYQNRIIEKLHVKATTDSLTQIKNRATFDEYLQQSIVNYHRLGEPLSLIICDIDHFKRINDTHGHVIGDRVLEAMAVKLKVSMRAGDFISRYGGEEFGAILLRTNLAGAVIVAENMRNAVETTVFNVEGNKMRITVSLGCAEIAEGDTADKLIKRADKQLYLAKSNGRNMVYPRPADLVDE